MDPNTTGTGTTTEERERKIQAELRDSAHRIWLAGMCALAAAEEGGAKVFQRRLRSQTDDRGDVEDGARSQGPGAGRGGQAEGRADVERPG